ncbi:MAG: cob(I)yrinic acid a,c-diamide adenosyltransferase [Planctomycetes bacterium]|nr:cob(I)yrinic acid a,c-diamide adenosyltransferase [Planctomycetota bacterium]
MKIYTKTGDDGSTGLFGGGRVPKHDARVEAYGTVDELNSQLGVALCDEGDDEIKTALRLHQAELLELGAVLADGKATGTPKANVAVLAEMERQIDRWTDELAPLKNFILPGGTHFAATLHLARTVCRRAERCVSRIRVEQPKLAQRVLPVLVYLNRLSDWLFTAARLANKRGGVEDILWKPKGTQ